jgi:SOS-response transcriptional repressor LexA
MSLTEKEQQALDAILELSKDGVPPTFAQVMAARGSRSFNGTDRLLRSLRKKGFLVKWPGPRQPVILLTPEAQKSAA